MASQVTRRQMERWLLDHGFTPKAGKKTSHRQFHGHDVTVTLPGHGAPDLQEAPGHAPKAARSGGIREDCAARRSQAVKPGLVRRPARITDLASMRHSEAPPLSDRASRIPA